MTSASHPIVIPDDAPLYPLESFVIPKFYRDELKGVLVPAGFLRDRTQRMAQEIADFYGSDSIVALGILNGCYRFYYELLEELKHYQRGPVHTEFIRIKSYVDAESKDIKILSDEATLTALKGKRVLIVEDIIDTGRSMTRFLDLLHSTEAYRPQDIRIAALTVKRTERNVEGLRPDFAGFSIPDHFIVGCALDYNRLFRDLPHVCVLTEQARAKYAAATALPTGGTGSSNGAIR